MSYPADPYWLYVKALMHFDGVHGSTKIVDERHVTVAPGYGFLSKLKTKFGQTALRCQGVGAGTSHTLGVVNQGPTYDMCLEFWMYTEETTNANPLAVSLYNTSGYHGYGVAVDGSTAPGKLAVFYSGFSTSAHLFASASDVVYNQWCHVAVTRTGSTFRLFINGVLDAQASDSSAIATSLFMQCGSAYSGAASTAFLGYLADVRFTYGVSRYTANFTPPAAAFPHSGVVDADYDKVVLHMPCNGENGNSDIIDLKGHKVSLTPTAAGVLPVHQVSAGTFKFGGSGVNAVSNAFGVTHADMNPGTQDFTLEFYLYSGAAGTATTHPIVQFPGTDGITNGLLLSGSPNNYTLTLVVNDITAFSLVSGANNTGWVAITRVGTTISVYAGGQLKGTYNIGSAAISSNDTVVFNGVASAQRSFDEIRYTKGASRYAGNFTPTTEPFPQVGIQRLSGTVMDESNNPISRKVRAFRRSDGLLTDTVMSDPTTGAFELRATDTSEHYVVVFDDSKNALVYDHIVPVV